jgi:hypothetical protein
MRRCARRASRHRTCAARVRGKRLRRRRLLTSDTSVAEARATRGAQRALHVCTARRGRVDSVRVVGGRRGRKRPCGRGGMSVAHAPSPCSANHVCSSWRLRRRSSRSPRAPGPSRSGAHAGASVRTKSRRASTGVGRAASVVARS